MKPRNFPERKRQRQIAALDRLPVPQIGHQVTERLQELGALHEAIAAGSRRNVRTKKDRSAAARFAR